MEDRSILIAIGLIAAAAVAYSGHDGWGWILFVTALII